MSRKQLTTGVAVAVSLAVVAFFFIFINPFLQQSAASVPQEAVSTNVVIQDQAVGTGSEAKLGDVITVNYTGRLSDGTVFDTSVGREPLQFMLGASNIIPGWNQGIEGMKVGGKRLLIIPPALAYGSQGIGPIPPNATLIFEVDLLDVAQASSSPASLDAQ